MKKDDLISSLVSRVSKRLAPMIPQSDTSDSPKRTLSLEVLEPRVLFSGSPAPAPAPEPAPAAQQAPAPAPAEAAPAPEAAAPAEETNIAAPPPSTAEETPPAAQETGDTQGVTAIALTESELAAVAEAASERWAESGLTDAQSDALASINYVIDDLDGAYLGAADGNTVAIDIDAAGNGWFVDSTPLEDSEFIFSGNTLVAEDGEAASKVDLLTTILHEQGHILGLPDVVESENLMSEFLDYGERRLPGSDQAEGAIPGSIDEISYLTFGPTTDDYETDETDGANVFSEPGGPDFNLGGNLLVKNFATYGANASDWYIEGGVTGDSFGTITVDPSATFTVVGMNVWVSSDGGTNADQGDVTFTGTPAAGGGTVTATFTVDSGIPNPGDFFAVSFAGTALDGVELSSLDVSRGSGESLNYVAIDDFNFSAVLPDPPAAEDYASAVLADNPISFWQFNEGEGTTTFDSAGTNDGNFTSGNTPNWVGGRTGLSGDSSVYFSTGPRIDIANGATAFDSVFTNQQVTVEFWGYGDPEFQPRNNETFNLGNNAGNRVAFAHLPWGNQNIYWDSGLNCCGAGSRLSTGYAQTDYEGKWNHYAFVKDANTNFSGIYINGELTASTTNSTDPLGNPDFFRIGAGHVGALDDFAIFDQALTQDQIRTHIAAATPTPADDTGSTDDNTALIVTATGARENLALSGTATQFTTRAAGGAAERAIDGNTNGNFNGNSVTHTNGVSYNWWQVELDQESVIDEIILYNRADCCGNRLSQFRVSVFDGDPDAGGTEIFAHNVSGQVAQGGSLSIDVGTLMPGVQGEFIRVAIDPLSAAGEAGMNGDGVNPGGNVLSLAEVQVFGSVPTGDGILFNDSYTGSTPTITVQGEVVPVGSSATVTTDLGGEVTVYSDGSYTYNPDGSETLDALAAGDSLTDTFTYSISDGNPYRNLALAGTATQSSTRGGILNNNASGGNVASVAIDGNTDGNWGANSTTHTNNAAFSWWQVELPDASVINEVNLFTRVGCCGGGRNTELRLSVYDGNPDDGGTLVAFQDLPNIPQGGNLNVDFGGVVGDFIRVAIDPAGDGINAGGGTLSLAEVEVMGTSAVTSNWNLAAGKIATQSSTGAGGLASRAVDGNTDGQWGAGSTTHTANVARSWWQVDLGESNAVDEVVLHNRADCCGGRLSQVRVSLYDGDPNTGGTEVSFVDIPGQVPQGGSMSVDFGGAVGDFVRVQIDPDGDGLNADGNGILSLAEVQVFGGFTFPEISSEVALWLDATDIDGDGSADRLADGSAVKIWADKSGNGHGATLGGGTGNDPTYVASSEKGGGLPAVSFDGNDQLVTNFNFDTLGADYTIVTVARYAGTQGVGGDYERLISSDSHNWLFGYWGNSTERVYAEGWVHQGAQVASNLGDNELHIHTGIYGPSVNGNAGDPGADIFKDGVQLADNSTGSNNTVYKPGQLSLGAFTNNGQEASVGEVSEVLIFDGALSSVERKLIEAHLEAKYRAADATVSITVDGVNDSPIGIDDVVTTDEDTIITSDAAPVVDLLHLDSYATGDHTVTADGQTFESRVENVDGTGWLLVGRGQAGWDFDTDGPGGSVDLVNDGLGTAAAFTPTAYSDAIINDLITSSGLDLTDVEIRIKRAADPNGDNYQQDLWRPTSQTTWTWDFDNASGFAVEHEVLTAGTFDGNVAYSGAQGSHNANTRDEGPNDFRRIFTWAWGGHDNQQGFSYGNSVNNGSNTGSFLWEDANENHAIPYTEIYIRAKTGTQEVPGVLANDVDPEGDTITVLSSDTVSANGAAVAVNADGSYTYDPTGSAAIQALGVGESIVDTFTYVPTDGNPSAVPTNGRFIRVENNGTGSRRMDIGEIEVFAPGVTPAVDNAGGTGALNPTTDLATTANGASVHSKTTNQPHGGDDDGRLIDGAETTGGGTWSSNGVGNFVIIDLGSSVDIETIRVHQRNDGCCQDRLRDITVTVLADDGTGNPGDAVQSAVFAGQPATNSFAELTMDPISSDPTVTVNVTVNGVNDPPVANDDGPFTTDEDTPIISKTASENYAAEIQSLGSDGSLIGFWDFNEGSGGTAVDSSGNGNNGTISGASYTADGGGFTGETGNSALDFGNGADRVVIGSAASGAFDDTATNNAVTLSFWQLGDPAQPQSDTIFSGNNSGNRQFQSHLPWGNSQVYWDTGGCCGGNQRINAVASTDQFEGQWNHWTFVKDGSDTAVYVNGNFFMGKTGQTNALEAINEFVIGAERTNGANDYNGLIDDFAVFSKGLDATEVADLFASAVSENLLDNDTDPDGDVLTVVGHDDPSRLGAQVTVEADGAFTYDPEQVDQIGFDGTVGGVAAVGGTWNGTPQTDAAPLTPLSQNAITFDGTGDLMIPVNPSETSYTLSAWFKTTDSNVMIAQITNSGNLSQHDRNIWIDAAGQLNTRIWSEETITSPLTYNDGEWHQVTHVFGGASGGQKMYVDGVEVANGVKSQSDFGDAFPANTLRIGGGNAAGSFVGEIGGVQIFDEAFSAERVAFDYNGSFNGMAENTQVNDTFTYTISDQKPLQIDINSDGSATAEGWTGLDLTTASGNGENVTVDGVTFQLFTSDGHRDRASSSDDLTGDFAFDDGSNQAVGLQIFDLPDGMWKAEVWAWDNDFPATGDMIVGYQGSSGEVILTNSFTPNPDAPFTFTFDSSELPDGNGIFTRENNGDNRSRMNALRLTPIETEYTSVGTFTGSNVGEGLDLTGDFVYAVNARGPAVGAIGDASFTDEAGEPGVTISSSNEILNWQSPDFDGGDGGSGGGAEGGLETVLQSIRWTPQPNSVTVDADVTAGTVYKMQLLFFEPNNSNRGFDISAEGELIVDNFTAGIAPNGNTTGTVVTHTFVATDNQLNVVLNGVNTGFGDKNPILQGFTLEEVAITDTATVTIDVDGLNDAPILTTAATTNMNDVSVADTANDGDLVSDLYGFGITDVDADSVEGIAITGAAVDAPGTGYFEFSSDGGMNWDLIDTVSDTSALLLLPTDRVRFVPDGTNQTGGTLSYRAWDQTGGTDTLVHTKVDASTTGGTTPFSTATATATAGVYNVVIDNGEIIYTAGDGEVNDIRVSIDPVTGELLIVDANGNPVTTGEVDSDPSGTGIGIAYSGEDLTIETNVEDDIIRFGAMAGFTGSITADGGEDLDRIESFRTEATLGATSSIDMDAEEIKLMLSSFTAGGDIDLNGTDATGAATGTNYDGIWLYGTDLETTVAGSTITLAGEGGDTGTYNNGIKLTNGSDVTTADGDIDIDGAGGGNALFGTGVALHHGSSLSAGGSGNLTIDGTAGAGSSFNEGVFLSTYTSATVADGDLTITGTGNGTGSQNQGVDLSVATLTATGTGNIAVIGSGSGSGTGTHNTGVTTNATDITTTTGTVTLAGSGGAGTSNNQGVRLAATDVTTTGGSIDVDGTGNGSAVYNTGVQLVGSTLDAGGAGTIDVDGTAGAGTVFNEGVQLSAGSTVKTDTGAIGIRGTGMGTITGNRGVTLISSTAESTGGGDITLLGTASTASIGALNDGISLSYSHATTTGTLTMAGTGGGGSVLNTGVKVVGGSLSGTLDIDGTGGGSAHSNAGVYIMNSDLGNSPGTITGTGGAGSGVNFGAFMQGIIGGFSGTVTTDPDDDEEKGGNFFPTILPLLMAEADRRTRIAKPRTRRQKHEIDDASATLNALHGIFARVRSHGGLGDYSSDETPVFRSLDGHVTLDPTVASSEMIDTSFESLGIQVPETPEATRRVLLLTGEDIDQLAGIIAYVDHDGELVDWKSLPGSQSSATLGEFLQILERSAQSADTTSDARWSNQANPSSRSTPVFDKASHSFSDAFGLL